MPNLAPSEGLLREFQSQEITWAKFKSRYRAELFENGSIDSRNSTIKNHGQKFTLRMLRALSERGPVTLMCHCDENQVQCHRHILKEMLMRDF
jgi:uncharacterized protein YeaO (DUF488 family)